MYAIAHHQPCAQRDISGKVVRWLTGNTKWEGQKYTDTVIH